METTISAGASKRLSHCAATTLFDMRASYYRRRRNGSNLVPEGTPTLQELSIGKIDNKFLDASYEWFRDPWLRKMMLAPIVTKQAQIEWYRSLSDRSDYLIWGVKCREKWLGAFGLKNISSASRRAEYWGYIGESAARGKGVGRWMIETAVQFAAEKKLETIYLKVYKKNDRAIGLYERLGFLKTGEGDKYYVMARKTK